jgi:hypothetical protein
MNIIKSIVCGLLSSILLTTAFIVYLCEFNINPSAWLVFSVFGSLWAGVTTLHQFRPKETEYYFTYTTCIVALYFFILIILLWITYLFPVWFIALVITGLFVIFGKMEITTK